MSRLSARLSALEQRHDTAGLLPIGNVYDGSMTAGEITIFLDNFL